MALRLCLANHDQPLRQLHVINAPPRHTENTASHVALRAKLVLSLAQVDAFSQAAEARSPQRMPVARTIARGQAS